MCGKILFPDIHPGRVSGFDAVSVAQLVCFQHLCDRFGAPADAIHTENLLADLSVHGCLKSVKSFPAVESLDGAHVSALFH